MTTLFRRTLSAAEIRAEMVALFQRAFPEYRLLKVIPAPGEARLRRRQPVRNETDATLIGTGGIGYQPELTDPGTDPHSDHFTPAPHALSQCSECSTRANWS